MHRPNPPMNVWSSWYPFPDPNSGGFLFAPFGPGVYELHNRATGELVNCGQSKYLAKRMTSLLPSNAGGSGTRNNHDLREYILYNINGIEYRTRACADKKTAQEEKAKMQRYNKYLF